MIKFTPQDISVLRELEIFPQDLKDLASLLRVQLNSPTDWFHNNSSDMDVRIQYVDGSLKFHTGDTQYDTDHRGYWGYANLNRYELDMYEKAKELVNDMLDHVSSVTDLYDKVK